MKLLRTFVIVAGVALALGATADRAHAAGIGVPCVGCNNGGGGGFGAGFGGGGGGRTTLFGGRQGGQGGQGGGGGFGSNLNLFHQQKLPVFQAAPWYNYWPYDGHFMTPAPVTGAFYGPPATGNFPVNPYFPGAQGAAGFSGGYGYGAMPGGPPTGYGPPVPQQMPMPPGR